MLVNIDPIQPDASATPNLWNTRFSAITSVINGNIDSDNLKNNAVTTEKISNGAVTNDKLNLLFEYDNDGSFVNMGNFIIQWGRTLVSSTGTDIVFPRPFSSLPTITMTIQDTNDQTAWLLTSSNTKFRAKQPWTPTPLTVNWIAVGPA